MKRQIALPLALLLCLTGWATASTLYVPGDYTEIHDAVQACSGPTLLERTELYDEHCWQRTFRYVIVAV